MSLNWKSITVISFSVILIFVITFFAIGTSGFKNWDTSTWFGKGEQTEEETQLNSYTVSADMYKNLKKFSHWEDEEGKTVSSEIVYTYQSEKEKQLTAIYTDFINMEGEAWNVDSKTYNTSEYGEDGWLKMAYLTEPLTYGMSIEFTISPNTKQFIFGLSNYERVTNASEYGWCKDGTNNLDELFVPAFNIYSGTEVSSREQLGYLQQIDNLSQMNTIGKNYFSNPSIQVPLTLPSNYKIKLVLDNEILVYFNGELLLTTFPNSSVIDKNLNYYFSFSANNCEKMEITFFDKDFYIDNRGNFSELVSTSVLDLEDFQNKKITFIGDSITYGVGVSNSSNRYSTLLSNELGMVETNLGISGTVYCTGGPDGRQSRIYAVDEVNYNQDYVIVNLGINDFDNAISNKFAELGEFGSTDTYTIYGAINVMYKKLVDRFRCTNTKIIITTPVTTTWKNAHLGAANVCGYTLRDLCDAVIETAHYYGLIYLDLNKECPLDVTQDLPDGLHPNELGTNKMANCIKQFMLKNFEYTNN